MPNQCRVIAVKMPILTPEECEQIIALGPATAVKKSAGTMAGAGWRSAFRRRGTVWWLPQGGCWGWLYRRIATELEAVNDTCYGFDLDRFDLLQLTRYGVGDHYAYHFDSDHPELADRKLTMSVQLSSPRDYLGGSLIARGSGGDTVAPRQQGHAVVFPPFIKHRASPVLLGVRWALVAFGRGAYPLR